MAWCRDWIAHIQIALHKRDDLVEQHVWPGMDDAQEGLVEAFEEMEGQLDKEVARLETLKVLRREDPGEMIASCISRHRANGKTLSTSSTTIQISRASTLLQTPRQMPVNSHGIPLRQQLLSRNRRRLPGMSSDCGVDCANAQTNE